MECRNWKNIRGLSVLSFQEIMVGIVIHYERFDVISLPIYAFVDLWILMSLKLIIYFPQTGLMGFTLLWGTYVIRTGWEGGFCLKRRVTLHCSFQKDGGYLVLIRLSIVTLMSISSSFLQSYACLRYFLLHLLTYFFV